MSQNPYTWRPTDLEAIRVTLRIPVTPASIAAINEEMAALERTYPDAIPAAKSHLDAIALIDNPPASGPGPSTPAEPVVRKRTRKGAAGPVPAELPRSKLDVIEFATELLMEEVSEEFVIPSDPSAAALAGRAQQRRHHVASLLLILPRLENWIPRRPAGDRSLARCCVVEPTPLQSEASVRLLLPLLQHPRAKAPVIIAWHVLEAFIKQRKLLTSRDGGPGQDSGDLLCTGFITRGAELPPVLSGPWTWLASDLAWQTNALRPVHQPAPLPLPDPLNPGVPPSAGNTWTPRPRVLQPPVEQGVAWLGDLEALQSPGVLPPQPRAQLAGCSLLTAGFPFGEGGIGRLVQSQLGEAIEFVLKPQRVIVIEPGDSLRVLAERYGTTVQTLRSINPSLLSLDTVLTAAGDTLLSLAGQYGTTVEWLMANNTTLKRWGGHTVVDGDSLKSLAELYFTTSDTLRLYNAPTYDFFSRSEPLPVGVHLVVPLVRPSTPLEPGQNLVVPLYRPGTLLLFDSWIHLPKARRTAVDPDDRSYLDAPEPEPEPDPQPEPTPEPAP